MVSLLWRETRDLFAKDCPSPAWLAVLFNGARFVWERVARLPDFYDAFS
jgi:hypothetical protein